MAPRLKRRARGWRNLPDGSKSARAILPNWPDGCRRRSCDGVLLDLGVSSPQLDSPGRGFSFQQDGPLDMRMDTRQPLTAADLVNGASADELARIFWEFGGEQDSRRLAQCHCR